MKNLPPELVIEILLYALPENQYHYFFDVIKISKKAKKVFILSKIEFFKDIVVSSYFKLQVIKLIESKYGINLSRFSKKSSFIKGNRPWKKPEANRMATLEFEGCKSKCIYPRTSSALKAITFYFTLMSCL